MGLQDEYAVIAQGMRNGTLKERPPDEAPKLWTSKRFSNSISHESFNSREESSRAFSFGLCTLDTSRKVYISEEMARGTVGAISPGPLAYSLRGSFGPKSAQFSESTASHAPNAHFGTDLRHSAAVREAKAKSHPVDAELEYIRTHASANLFKNGGAPFTSKLLRE